MEMTANFDAELADAERVKNLINSKPGLKQFYLNCYQSYAKALHSTPQNGLAIELGSGLGFVKDVLPEIITTDVIPYLGLDQIVDATKMPFADESLRFIGMINVFHHIPRVQDFLTEAQRCLIPGGKILIIDQYPGLFSKYIYKYAHKEPYDEKATNWDFTSSNPLNDANGALAWIVFKRDFKKFQQNYPQLRLDKYKTHSPTLYWLSGGLKKWDLVPRSEIVKIVNWGDNAMAKLIPQLGSFVEISISKVIQ